MQSAPEPISLQDLEKITADPSNYAEVIPSNIPDAITPSGKQPRNLQNRSKYLPHQNRRECHRRLKQIVEGKLAAHPETIDKIIEIAVQAAKETLGVSETAENQEDR